MSGDYGNVLSLSTPETTGFRYDGRPEPETESLERALLQALEVQASSSAAHPPAGPRGVPPALPRVTHRRRHREIRQRHQVAPAGHRRKDPGRRCPARVTRPGHLRGGTGRFPRRLQRRCRRRRGLGGGVEGAGGAAEGLPEDSGCCRRERRRGGRRRQGGVVPAAGGGGAGGIGDREGREGGGEDQEGHRVQN